ncbi:hypothetical protein [Streptomyces sp. NPDC017448]|uniref:hypothetical protein n=1 Tax=Streptomyces sp. NPDC017448 TaxID=3364996 RepID=UPI00378A32E6
MPPGARSTEEQEPVPEPEWDWDIIISGKGSELDVTGKLRREDVPDILRQVIARYESKNIGAQVSEYRCVYWHTDVEKPSSYKVRRDWENRSDRWGIFDGDVLVWTGDGWEPMSGVPAAFMWELPEALAEAKRLAMEENAFRIETMEKRFPGQFKGGPWDMASAQWTGRGGT